MGNKLFCRMIAVILIISLLGGCAILRQSSVDSDSRNQDEYLFPDYITKEEAIEEFDYLCDILEESYPYIGLVKRKYGIDFNDTKSFHRSKLEEGPDRIAFQKYHSRLQKFTGNFAYTGHLSVVTAKVYETMYESCIKDNGKIFPMHLEALNQPKSIIVYEGLGVNRNIENIVQKEKTDDPVSHNVKFEILDDSTAYIKIYSFALENIERDKEKLFEFYEEISDYDYLIIDITENAGGATDYYLQLIISPNMDRELIVKHPPLFIQGSELNQRYMKTFTPELKDMTKFDFERYPDYNEEDFKQFDYYAEVVDRFQPIFNEKMFQGEIYVLISGLVYSSADSFAAICKSTGFATLVGNNTRGGGGGGNPIFVSLPNSGLIVQFDSIYTVNETGQCREEFGTAPDIYSERGYELQTCLDIIEESKTNNLK